MWHGITQYLPGNSSTLLANSMAATCIPRHTPTYINRWINCASIFHSDQ